MDAYQPPQPDSQKLHDRAAESARETRQAILTLASGALAVFFVVLTSEGEVKPALLTFEKIVMFAALICMSVAVFAALWSAHADAQWSYSWAVLLAPPAGETKTKDQLKADHDRWHSHKRFCERMLTIAFALGVLFAAFYLASRIFTLN